ncbi:MAG: hypothetical protein R3212_09995, partial [Xanthomonadales bacterium]|nr:hypothetical protein [Xanthomonadales bacterium]
MSFNRALLIVLAAMMIPGIALAQTRATFPVTVDFDDNNPGSVQVDLDCNTGQPLSQSLDISEGDGGAFVVVDFVDGTMDCDVSISSADGYTASEGCTFTDIVDQSVNACDFDLTVDFVTVEVFKVWIDENPQFNSNNFATADYSCVSVFNGTTYQNQNGGLSFLGDNTSDSFSLRPNWNGSTVCSITEMPVNGAETDASECDSINVL